MCGIGGIFQGGTANLDVENLCGRILKEQRHRGPDGEGVWLSTDRRIGLCHNRLAILDLSPAGAQPMVSGDGQLAIVFNGEIYNWKELRSRFERSGWRFSSGTDTEVLLAAYEEWGESMLEHLRGMFAFALYDVRRNTLLCARDRVGKKPFVYAETSDAFIFGSEIPAVRQVPGVDTRYDRDAIAAMLLHNLRHIPDPHTAYCGIRRLRPGHAMLVRDGRIERIWRYWSPSPAQGDISAGRLRELVEEAVELRMHADVPVGALLSGGIDSSAIVAIMQRTSSEPVRTYSLGRDAADEDVRRARVIAQTLGTRHREFYFDPEEQWDIFRHLIALYGEPIMLLPLVHTFVLCRAVHEDGLKVVLNGNGADELFYGYTGHVRTLKVSRWLDRLAPLRPFMAPLKLTRVAWLSARSGARKAAWYRSFAQSEWAQYLSDDARSTVANVASDELEYWGELCPSPHFIDESNFVGLMVENAHSVTIAGDLPAMATSVETRSPFLDQEIVSFALATPAKKKIPNPANADWLKAILREAVRDLIPDTLLRAPKRGFGMGIQEADVLRGPWRGKAEELFQSAADTDGLFDRERLLTQWRGFLAGAVPAYRIAKMLAIQMWLQTEQTDARE